jgi:short-subunit dehydrogenase involved in D-alanine esterification of teichoic acids
MRKLKRIEMVDAWTQTSNRGTDTEDKNKVHVGKIMIATKDKAKYQDDKRMSIIENQAKKVDGFLSSPDKFKFQPH